MHERVLHVMEYLCHQHRARLVVLVRQVLKNLGEGYVKATRYANGEE